MGRVGGGLITMLWARVAEMGREESRVGDQAPAARMMQSASRVCSVDVFSSETGM